MAYVAVPQMPALGAGITLGNHTPRLACVGDSITDGVGATALAGWREGVYNASVAAGTPVQMVGSATTHAGGLPAAQQGHLGFAGSVIRHNTVPVGSLLTVVYNDGVRAGSLISGYPADIIINAGGTNDIGTLGDPAATVLASMETQLDYTWATRSYAHLQIIQLSLLKRYDGFDTVVQTVNAGLQAMIATKSYRANVTYCDVFSSITSGAAGYAGGTLHPNDTGYGEMAPVIWSAVSSVWALARGPV